MGKIGLWFFIRCTKTIDFFSTFKYTVKEEKEVLAQKWEQFKKEDDS